MLRWLVVFPFLLLFVAASVRSDSDVAIEKKQDSDETALLDLLDELKKTNREETDQENGEAKFLATVEDEDEGKNDDIDKIEQELFSGQESSSKDTNAEKNGQESGDAAAKLFIDNLEKDLDQIEDDDTHDDEDENDEERNGDDTQDEEQNDEDRNEEDSNDDENDVELENLIEKEINDNEENKAIDESNNLEQITEENYNDPTTSLNEEISEDQKESEEDEELFENLTDDVNDDDDSDDDNDDINNTVHDRFAYPSDDVVETELAMPASDQSNQQSTLQHEEILTNQAAESKDTKEDDAHDQDEMEREKRLWKGGRSSGGRRSGSRYGGRFGSRYGGRFGRRSVSRYGGRFGRRSVSRSFRRSVRRISRGAVRRSIRRTIRRSVGRMVRRTPRVRRVIARYVRKPIRRIVRKYRRVRIPRIRRTFRRYVRKPIRRIVRKYRRVRIPRIRRTFRRYVRKPIRRIVRKYRRVRIPRIRRKIPTLRLPRLRRVFGRFKTSYKKLIQRYRRYKNNKVIKKFIKKNKSWWDRNKYKIAKNLDKIQTGLDLAGLIPGVGVVPDGVNAVIHAIRGNKEGFLTSVAAMVPGLGQGATLGKYGIKGAGKLAGKYGKFSVSGLVKGGKIENTYPRGGRIINEGYTKMNLKEAIAAFRNSVVPGSIKKPTKGVRIGVTPDGRTVTIRTKGGHGPTIEVKESDKVTNKFRIKG